MLRFAPLAGLAIPPPSNRQKPSGFGALQKGLTCHLCQSMLDLAVGFDPAAFRKKVTHL